MGGGKGAGGGQHVAPLDERALHPLKIYRGPLARKHFRDIQAVHLYPAHLAFEFGRIDKDGIAHLEPPRDARARYHRAEPPHREHAVDGQAERTVRAFRFDLAEEAGKGFFEVLDSFPCYGGYGNNLAAVKKMSPQKPPRCRLSHLHPVRIFHQVGFGEDDKPFLTRSSSQIPCARGSAA